MGASLSFTVRSCAWRFMMRAFFQEGSGVGLASAGTSEHFRILFRVIAAKLRVSAVLAQPPPSQFSHGKMNRNQTRTLWTRTLVSMVFVLALSHCGRDKDKPLPTDAVPAVTVAAAPPPPPLNLVLDALPSSAPGPAYLLDDEQRLWVVQTDGVMSEVEVPAIDKGKSDREQVATTKREVNKKDSKLDLWRGTDGRAYVTTNGAIFRLNEASAELMVAWSSERFNAAVLTLTAEPRLYVLGYKLVSERVTSRWEGRLLSEGIPYKSSLSVLLVGGAGEVWLENYKVAGSELSEVALSGNPLLGGSIVAGPAGIYFLRKDMVLRVAPGKSNAEVAYKNSGNELELLDVAADGKILVKRSMDRSSPVVRVGVDGKVSLVSTGQVHEYEEAIAIDSSGRVWDAIHNTLVVVDTTSKKQRNAKYGYGTLPIDAPIVKLLIVGSGPSTLPQPQAARTGGLRAKIAQKDGTPGPHNKVAVCPQPDLTFSGSTPCERGPTRVTESNAEGIYEVRDLPAGPYRWAVHQNGGTWNIASSQILIRGGTITDLTK
jgi:hypothetical protein